MSDRLGLNFVASSSIYTIRIGCCRLSRGFQVNLAVALLFFMQELQEKSFKEV
jgi:hypothetical protein